MKRAFLLLLTAITALSLAFPAAVLAKRSEPKTLTQQQIVNRARKAAEKAREKAEKEERRREKMERRRLRQEERARLREEARTRLGREDDDTTDDERGELSSNRSGTAVTGLIRVTHLDYSCWRYQSDSDDPVFIEKHKPFVDLETKVSRCFTGREHEGYDDPDFTVTYTVEGKSQKFTADTDRRSWTDLSPGCYRATLTDDGEDLTDFRKVSCS